MTRPPPRSTLFPYTTLFRSEHDAAVKLLKDALDREPGPELTEKVKLRLGVCLAAKGDTKGALGQLEPIARNEKSPRSEEHTFELQSRQYLVCRLLLEKKKQR